MPALVEKIELHPYVHGNCTWLFNTLLICWNGTVVPCCQLGYKQVSMGNILDLGARELWNNVRFRACREFLFNYGPKQEARSICRTADCAVRQKYAGAMD